MTYIEQKIELSDIGLPCCHYCASENDWGKVTWWNNLTWCSDACVDAFCQPLIAIHALKSIIRKKGFGWVVERCDFYPAVRFAASIQSLDGNIAYASQGASTEYEALALAWEESLAHLEWVPDETEK
jgi:hypothetical protein